MGVQPWQHRTTTTTRTTTHTHMHARTRTHHHDHTCDHTRARACLLTGTCNRTRLPDLCRTLNYEGVPKANTVYSASFVTSWKMATVGTKSIPQVHGVGFAKGNNYQCKFYSVNTKSNTYSLPATYINSNLLSCDQPLLMDAKNPITKEYEAASSSFFNLGLALTIGTTDVPRVQPKNFPGNAATAKDLAFKAGALMCTDGVKQPYEIGPDCGKNACNKFCPADKLALGEKSPCDRNEDCKGACKSGKCTFQPCSCTEIYQANSGMKSGMYKISIDKKYGMKYARGDNEIVGDFEVYCDVDYDKTDKYKGAYTLVQTMHGSQLWNNYFNRASKDSDHDPALGRKWSSGTRNYASRFGLEKWNSIFKHSLGIVMTRYANNRAGYQLTDVYATPESGQHLQDAGNKCGQRSSLDIAHAYRIASNGRSGGTMGYCFNDGKLRQNNNCICSDSFQREFYFNRCPGKHGNVRRYNSYLKENRLCRGMHTKCHGYSNHGNLGDTYRCDKPGQRTVQGKCLLRSRSPRCSCSPCQSPRLELCDCTRACVMCTCVRWQRHSRACTRPIQLTHDAVLACVRAFGSLVFPGHMWYV